MAHSCIIKSDLLIEILIKRGLEFVDQSNTLTMSVHLPFAITKDLSKLQDWDPSIYQSHKELSLFPFNTHEFNFKIPQRNRKEPFLNSKSKFFAQKTHQNKREIWQNFPSGVTQLVLGVTSKRLINNICHESCNLNTNFNLQFFYMSSISWTFFYRLTHLM